MKTFVFYAVNKRGVVIEHAYKSTTYNKALKKYKQFWEKYERSVETTFVDSLELKDNPYKYIMLKNGKMLDCDDLTIQESYKFLELKGFDNVDCICIDGVKFGLTFWNILCSYMCDIILDCDSYCSVQCEGFDIDCANVLKFMKLANVHDVSTKDVLEYLTSMQKIVEDTDVYRFEE